MFTGHHWSHQLYAEGVRNLKRCEQCSLVVSCRNPVTNRMMITLLYVCASDDHSEIGNLVPAGWRNSDVSPAVPAKVFSDRCNA